MGDIMQTRSRLFRLTALATAVSLAGCASLNQLGRDYGTAIGCVGGAMAGAALGAVISGKAKDIAIGAASGAAVGCAAGYAWQNRLQELERVAREENLRMQVETLRRQAPVQPGKPVGPAEDVGIVAQVQDQGMFPVGSDQLTPDGRRQVEKLAQVFRQQLSEGGSSRALLVVGHTDATGTAESNQRLSEQRARTVGAVLARAGVNPSNIYYQGAGASRPIADNGTPSGRAANRRVEIVEVASTEILKQRVAQEQANPRYLAHGTRTEATDAAPAPKAKTAKRPIAKKKAPAPAQPGTAIAKPSTPSVLPTAIDFGGAPAADVAWTLAGVIKPKRSGLSLISSAQASELPVRSCNEDQPRVAGAVKNLASGAELKQYATTAYLTNMNGRPWSGLVNGHQVTLSPVAVLRDGAQVVKPPAVLVVKDFERGNRHAAKLAALANAYEGEDSILYRVFVQEDGAPLSCIDVAMSKSSGNASGGKLYYPRSSRTVYAADYIPRGY